MKSLYFLGYHFNGLEFITYILLPVSIILIVLIYIYFNIRLIKISFDIDLVFLDDFDKKNKKYLEKIKKKIDKKKMDSEELEENFSEDLLILEKLSEKCDLKEKV